MQTKITHDMSKHICLHTNSDDGQKRKNEK